mgnify:CR=1 FL=1
MDFRGSLLKAGYRWIQPSAPTLPKKFSSLKGVKFIKRYVTSAGEFEILLINYQNDLTRLPFAYVTKKPAEFDGVALPHIRNSGYLCYADNDQTQWNPLDAESLAQAIDNSIAKTLQVAICKRDDSEEYHNEFSNYWEGYSTVFSFEALPTQAKNLKYCSLKVTNGQNVEEGIEFVVYTADHERDDWLKLRGKTSFVEEGSTIVVSVKPNNWAPTSTWPPSCFAEVVDWLAKADRSAHDNLIFQLVNLAAKRTLVVLNIVEEGKLGFKLTFSSRHHKLLESWRNRKKRSLKSMIQSFTSSKAIDFFCRLRVEEVDRNAIFLRNRPKPELGDIRNKRIALIGCGTIGGYVAELLVKSGAGVGTMGKLTLYDSDNLSVGNLGRHRLSARFLGWNKADGVAKLIEEESLHKVCVLAMKEDFEISADILMSYDLVIDATGRVPVSLALAGIIRSIQSKPPILIHGFNYNWGQESVAFIDNGKACYGCLGKLAPTKIKTPDFDTSRYSCGSLYTPYDASVSVISAGLIVDAVLNTLEAKLKWTYCNVTSDIKRPQKRLLLKAWADCEVCGRGKAS